MLTAKYHTEAQRFEQTLAFHGAPSMAGIKPADLFSWAGEPEETLALIDRFARDMARTGIAVRRLCFCRGRSLILVYRPDRLRAHLAQGEIRALLLRDGYPVEGGLEAMLDHLARRVLESSGFPHEVGLFLGYPVEDVEGFREHDGRNFKFCGLWKVYSDVERAQECFRRYSCCRKGLCRRLESGCSLDRVFRVVS